MENFSLDAVVCGCSCEVIKYCFDSKMASMAGQQNWPNWQGNKFGLNGRANIVLFK